MHGPQLQVRNADVAQELLQDALQPANLGLDHVEAPHDPLIAGGLGHAKVLLHQLEVQSDRRQRILDLVCEAREQRAEPRELPACAPPRAGTAKGPGQRSRRRQSSCRHPPAEALTGPRRTCCGVTAVDVVVGSSPGPALRSRSWIGRQRKPLTAETLSREHRGRPAPVAINPDRSRLGTAGLTSSRSDRLGTRQLAAGSDRGTCATRHGIGRERYRWASSGGESNPRYETSRSGMVS